MENDKGNVTNHFAAGSNCQVFNGPVRGSVFAMPGSTVTQQNTLAASQVSGEVLDDERLARAIEGCQAYFWANSAYAVLFCLLRDEFGIADNMSQFETMVEGLPYTRARDYDCPKGTIANAFNNNPVYKQHVGKWKDKASIRILKLLEELRLRLEL